MHWRYTQVKCDVLKNKKLQDCSFLHPRLIVSDISIGISTNGFSNGYLIGAAGSRSPAIPS